MKKIKLFCLPYAGGSSYIYKKWNENLAGYIDLFSIELSGRGSRYNEPLYNTMDEVVEDVYGIIKKDMAYSNYAILGHSFGSNIAYELVHKIQENHDLQPLHVFFAGAKAPDSPRRTEMFHKLNEHEFAQRLLEIGNTPKEIFENKELAEIFLPILRSDFKVNETYKYKARKSLINNDITVISGKEENMAEEEILRWKRHTSEDCKAFVVEGNHFFINSNYKDIIDIINTTLAKYIY